MLISSQKFDIYIDLRINNILGFLVINFFSIYNMKYILKKVKILIFRYVSFNLSLNFITLYTICQKLEK